MGFCVDTLMSGMNPGSVCCFSWSTALWCFSGEASSFTQISHSFCVFSQWVEDTVFALPFWGASLCDHTLTPLSCTYIICVLVQFSGLVSGLTEYTSDM